MVLVDLHVHVHVHVYTTAGIGWDSEIDYH